MLTLKVMMVARRRNVHSYFGYINVPTNIFERIDKVHRLEKEK